MPGMRSVLVLAAAFSLAASPALAQLYRCDSGGRVSYQDLPCPDATTAARPDIRTEFPPPNHMERDRLLQREAALDRRLEARRDRELVEAQMREARAEREAERERLAALQAQALPQYAVAFPAWRGYPGRRAGPHLVQYGRQVTLR